MTVLDTLIEDLSRLPGIGSKSATRMAHYILEKDESYARLLARHILDLKEKLRYCKRCGNYTEKDLCSICESPHRERDLICVVEQAADIKVLESSRMYRGLYFVLHGAISPLDGVGPEDLPLRQLCDMVKKESIQEVILATNPTTEGDTTALYIKGLFEGSDVKLSRLAAGLPVGGDLEYMNPMTLARSFQGRMSMK